MLEAASTFIAENGLTFRDFNDWIIVFEAHSRDVPLVTFDKTLSEMGERGCFLFSRSLALILSAMMLVWNKS